MLDSVDQHALDRVHVFDHARHQVARRPIIEPAQRQQLNVRIQIAAQIENDFLLECVVQNDPKRIENVLNNKSHCGEQNQRQQFVRPVRADHILNDPFGHTRKHDHHQRAEDRARERSRSQPGIPL